jgi:hypothetical protein
MLRKILLTLAVLFVLVVGGGVYWLSRLDHEFEEDVHKAQAKLAPQVVKGASLLTKRIFHTTNDARQIWQLLVGWPADREGAMLTVVTDEGVHFLDRSGAERKAIHFSEREACPIALAQTDKAGDYVFVTREQSWACDVVLFDSQGRKRWSYPGTRINNGVDDAVVLNTGEQLQVVVGFNGKGGVTLLDADGQTVWNQVDGNVWHVETIDLHSDGQKQIIHTNAKHQFVIRSANGEVLVRHSPSAAISDFALTRWGNESMPRHILAPATISKGQCCVPTFLVLDGEAKTIAELDAPLSNLLYEAQGSPVQLARGTAYFAVLQKRQSIDRSMLYLYDKDGQLVFQEILGATCSGIVPIAVANAEQLLVGCSNSIFAYGLAPEAPIIVRPLLPQPAAR